MAEGRKEPADPVSFAYRARDLLVTEDQDLEVLVAVPTMIFKDRHVILCSL